MTAAALICAALICAACLAPAAAADTPVRDHARGVAEAHWGTPDCGRPTIRMAYLGGNVLGRAIGCRIVLDRHHPSAEICSTVVHEWGHLIGHGHSSDPLSVMFPKLVRIFPGCGDAR